MAVPHLVQQFEEYGQHTIINQAIIDDGRGGWTTTWTDGAHFNAAVILQTSDEAKIAQAMGVVGNYTVTFEREKRLPWHTVFRRESDKKIFRITSKDEQSAPSISTIKTRITTAEEWVIPVNE